MEDLNNLLNGGEVPSLFPADERVQARPLPATACQTCQRHATPCNLPARCCVHEANSRARATCRRRAPRRSWSSSARTPRARACTRRRRCGHADACHAHVRAVMSPGAGWPDRAGGERGGRAQAWAFFVAECRRNLHVALCLSPVGAAFRERLRQNPSLVNCCTFDWFQAGPCAIPCRVSHPAARPSARGRLGTMRSVDLH